MWHDHPFNQRNKAAKRAVRVETDGGGGGEGGWTKLEKKKGGVGNIGGGEGGLRTICQLC